MVELVVMKISPPAGWFAEALFNALTMEGTALLWYLAPEHLYYLYLFLCLVIAALSFSGNRLKCWGFFWTLIARFRQASCLKLSIFFFL